MSDVPFTDSFGVQWDPIELEHLARRGDPTRRVQERLARLEAAVKKSQGFTDDPSFQQTFAEVQRRRSSGGSQKPRTPSRDRTHTLPQRAFGKKKPGVQTFSAQSLSPAYRNDPGAADRLRALSGSGINRPQASRTSGRGILFSESGFGRSQVPGFSSSSAGVRALRTRVGYVLSGRQLFTSFGRSAGVLFAVGITGEAFQEVFREREAARAAGKTNPPLWKEVANPFHKLGVGIKNAFLNTLGIAQQAAFGLAGLTLSAFQDERSARNAESTANQMREGIEFLTTGQIGRVARMAAKNAYVEKSLFEARQRALEVYDDFQDRNYVDLYRMGFGTEKAVRSFLGEKREAYARVGVANAGRQLQEQGYLPAGINK